MDLAPLTPVSPWTDKTPAAGYPERSARRISLSIARPEPGFRSISVPVRAMTATIVAAINNWCACRRVFRQRHDERFFLSAAS